MDYVSTVSHSRHTQVAMDYVSTAVQERDPSINLERVRAVMGALGHSSLFLSLSCRWAMLGSIKTYKT